MTYPGYLQLVTDETAWMCSSIFFFLVEYIYSVLGERLVVCTLNGLHRVYGVGLKQMVL